MSVRRWKGTICPLCKGVVGSDLRCDCHCPVCRKRFCGDHAEPVHPDPMEDPDDA